MKLMAGKRGTYSETLCTHIGNNQVCRLSCVVYEPDGGRGLCPFHLFTLKDAGWDKCALTNGIPDGLEEAAKAEILRMFPDALTPEPKVQWRIWFQEAYEGFWSDTDRGLFDTEEEAKAACTKPYKGVRFPRRVLKNDKDTPLDPLPTMVKWRVWFMGNKCAPPSWVVSDGQPVIFDTEEEANKEIENYHYQYVAVRISPFDQEVALDPIPERKTNAPTHVGCREIVYHRTHVAFHPGRHTSGTYKLTLDELKAMVAKCEEMQSKRT